MLDTLRIVLKIALLVFVAESLVMFALPLANLPDIQWLHALADAVVLTAFIGPAVFVWIISPYAKARDESEKQLSLAKDEAHRVAQVAEEAKHEANLANRAKSEFLSTMSHELRTPLNAVFGFSEIIHTEAFGPLGNDKYLEYAGEIRAAGSHLLELINDILDLSKVEAGSEELHEEDIDVEPFLRSVLSLVKGRAAQSDITLILDMEENLPQFRADLRKLKQILVNLLTNAIKFSNSGESVTLKVWHSKDGYMFQITDTGKGMAAEEIPKALSKFGQVGGDQTLSREGTGLGLPLTKALVELHGGSFDLQSALGKGTAVTARFPVWRTIGR